MRPVGRLRSVARRRGLRSKAGSLVLATLRAGTAELGPHWAVICLLLRGHVTHAAFSTFLEILFVYVRLDVWCRICEKGRL